MDYLELKSFAEFKDLANPLHYVELSSDWTMVLTDVQGSTKAIQEGKYKLINMVGAAGVASLINSLGHRNFPFIFGGDGVTAAIPNHLVAKAKMALRATQKYSLENYGLKLRIALSPYQEIKANGGTIFVAKHGPNAQLTLGFFSGNGIQLSEEWLKSGKNALEDGEQVDIEIALQGLSCRWAPLNNLRGTILSLIIAPRVPANERSSLLLELIANIDNILELNDDRSNPVKSSNLMKEKLLRAVAIEGGLKGKAHSISFLCGLFFKLNLVFLARIAARIFGENKISSYVQATADHSDYRKFDDSLRMVVDCTVEGVGRLRIYLEQLANEQKIFFGMHQDPQALLTCFVKSLNDGDHLHFVDGNNGGYTLAAKELKKQLSLSNVPKMN